MAIVQKKDSTGTIGKILTRSVDSLINCININFLVSIISLRPYDMLTLGESE